jgi:hypothetical protein
VLSPEVPMHAPSNLLRVRVDPFFGIGNGFPFACGGGIESRETMKNHTRCSKATD